MDERTIKLLEIERVLAGLHPITPFGIKCKREMRPYMPGEEEELKKELERIEIIMELVDKQRSIFVDIRNVMRGIKDIQKSIERCLSGGVLNTVEFFEIKNFIASMKSIAISQKQLHWQMPEKYRVVELNEVEELLDPENSGLKTFYVYDCYSERLRNIRSKKTEFEHCLDVRRKELAKKVEEDLGVQIRAMGELTVSKSQQHMLDRLKSYPGLQISGETYMNITFKIKPDEELFRISKEIEALKEEEALEESKVLEELSGKMRGFAQAMLRNIDAIGNFDLLMAKAYLAVSHNGVKPAVSGGEGFVIIKGRHPLVEESLRKKGRQFTPISVKLSKGVALITGANMGGKTVSLKMLGLIAAMAQFGLFVPAEQMEFGLFNYIFLSAGDEQSIDMGLSTFGAEMKSIKEALLMSENRGLILVDEMARGTNPHEGYAISAAIIDYLNSKPAVTVITTHIDGLAKEGIKHLQVKGLRDVDFDIVKNPESIGELMDYTLIEVQGEIEVPKDAINISRLIGIPEEILKQAESMMERE